MKERRSKGETERGKQAGRQAVMQAGRQRQRRYRCRAGALAAQLRGSAPCAPGSSATRVSEMGDGRLDEEEGCVG